MKPHISSFIRLTARGAVVLFILSLMLPGLLGQINTVKAAARCGAGMRCVYLPILSSGTRAATGDLSITGIEVTQGVQNSANSIPLVAGRSAVVRIFARGQEALPAGSSNVTVSIAANPSGAGLSSAPFLLSVNLPVTPSRGVYSSTINVPLPAVWLTGSYDLSITLDPQNQVPENNEGNNTFVQRLSFTNVPTLRVKIVPVRYTHSLDGHLYPAPTNDSISDWIMRLYPLSKVEISWHAPYTYNGNLKDVAGFSDLLSQISRLKKDEGGPADQVYYALAPTTDGNFSWFNGGVVGIGYIGNRVALGVNHSNAGQTAAHEIGHNLGRYHAPCGGAASSDPAYPYQSAAIGEYGLDLTTGALHAPDSSRDIMSYCSPKWISDYTYRALLDAQIRVASAASSLAAADMQTGPVLNVRALVTSTGTRLLPVYSAEGLPDMPAQDSPYRLQLMGVDGQVLADLPVPALEIATEDDQPQFEIQGSLSLPDAPVQTVRVWKADELLAETHLDGSPIAGSEVLLASANSAAATTLTGQVLRWPQADRPVVVRYSLDGGQSWTTLAMDVNGGQLDLTAAGVPETAQFEVIPAISH